MSDDLQVKIGADSTGLAAGLDGAASSVQSANARIEELLSRLNASFDSVADHIKKLNATPVKPPVTPEHLTGIGALQSHMQGLQGTVAGLVGKFNAVSAAIGAMAAGGAFKGLINSFIEEAGEVGKLASRLSITLTEASHLNVALQLIGSSSGDYLQAVNMLNRGIRTQGDYMAQLGLVTTDAKGKQLSQQEVMQNALRTLDSYKAGYDRNQASMAIFGRGADEVQKLLKMNNDVMAKAATLAKAYGNEFDAEAITATKEFKVAVSTVQFAVEQFGQAIGEKMLPRIQKTAEWFATEGPAAFAVFKDAVDAVFSVVEAVSSTLSEALSIVGGAVADVVRLFSDVVGLFTDGGNRAIDAGEMFKNAFNGVVIALTLMKASFLLGFEKIVTIVQVACGMVETILASLWSLMKDRNFDKATQVWNDHFAAVEDRARKHAANMKRILNEAQATISNAVEPKGPAEDNGREGRNRPAQEKPGRTFTAKEKGGGGKDSSDDLVKAQLAVKKAGLEAELALQKQMLAEQLAGDEDAHKNNLISLAAYWGERLRITQTGIQLEISAKKQELADAKAAENDPKVKNEKARLALTASRIKLEGEVAVLERKFNDAAIQNARERTDAERTLTNQLTTIRNDAEAALAMASIAHDEALSKAKLALGYITQDQELAAQRAFEDRKYAIEAKAAADRMALTNGDVVAQAKIYADIEKMNAAHQQALLDIDIQINAQRQKAVTQSLTDTRTAFESNINSLLNGTKTLMGSIKGILADVHASILKSLSSMGADAAMKALGGDKGDGGMLGKVFGSLFGGGSKSKDGLPLDGSKNALRVTNVDGAAGAAGGGSDATADPLTAMMDKIKESMSGVMDSLKSAFSSLGDSLSSIFSSMSGAGGGGGGFGALLGSIASFDVGTDSVPKDMLAMVHAGERITPAAYTGRGDGGDMTVQNHFHFAAPPDHRTQEQMARQAGQSISRANARRG